MKARNSTGALSEAAWQSQVLGLAKFYGWLTFHPADNRPTRDGAGRAGRQPVTAGFPDLVLVRVSVDAAELIFAELKPDKGAARATVAEVAARPWEWLRHRDISEQQADWLAALSLVAGVDLYIWRPADFDAVHARLARGRVRQEPAFAPARIDAPLSTTGGSA